MIPKEKEGRNYVEIQISREKEGNRKRDTWVKDRYRYLEKRGNEEVREM